MLVLSRKQHEQFVIGDGPDAITVTVLRIDRDRVKVWIDAPQHVRVDREEIRKEMDAERLVEADRVQSL